MLLKKSLFLTLLFFPGLWAESEVDGFGFQKLYPTMAGTLEWNSSHWANGNARTFGNWGTDADDPTGWTSDQSSSGEGFAIDGEGTMRMLSGSPRFHINSQNDENPTPTSQFFLNVEYTAYFMRDTLGGQNYGGMVVGLRSGSHNHGSSGRDNCLANTYYARFRNDGKWDFEKEWKHPDSYYRSGSGIGAQDPLWGGEVLPVGKWIGMKYVVYNKDSSTVRLELYIDSTSGGVPPGNWEAVGVAEDSGTDFLGAYTATIEGCAYTDAYAAILKGGGTALMRTDGDKPYYKFVTIREIDPFASFESESVRRNFSRPSLENVKILRFDAVGRPASKEIPQRTFEVRTRN